MITSMQNRTNFSVRNHNSAAENEFFTAVEERAAMQKQVNAMLSELLKTDLDAWAAMWEYSHNHTLVDTHETLTREFERIDGQDAKDEVAGLRAGL